MRARAIKRSFLFPKHLDGSALSGTGFVFIVVFFLAGAAIGSFAGSFLEAPILFRPELQETDSMLGEYIELFWDNSRFHLAAVFLSTTFLGIVLLPALSAVRGYLIGCTASAIMAAYPETGFLLSLVTLGIPLLVCLPCFLILSSDSFLYSARIMSYTRGLPGGSKLPNLYMHAVICFVIIAFWTLILLHISPLIISSILK